MALAAILLCVNFTSCSKDDDPTEETEEGGIVVSGKKLAQIVGTETSEDGSYSGTYAYVFNYDSQGKLVQAVYSEEDDMYKDTRGYQFVWGDDAIKVNRVDGSGSSLTYNLNDKLVRNSDNGDTFSYNSSNKFAKGIYEYDYVVTTIWDGDKLVSISRDEEDVTLKYGNSCQKGYFPLIATTIQDNPEFSLLFMAHPEIAGIRTSQLPTNVTVTEDYSGETETSTITYEFDKEGYISKFKIKRSDGSSTYTLTWK